MSGPSAFYLPDETISGQFESTELTRGPWDPASQHAGPPAALLARSIQLCAGLAPDPASRLVGRITFEILRPVPIGTLVVEAEVVRPGRRVDLVSASLRDAGSGEELIRARAWRLRGEELELPPGLSSTAPGGPPSRAGRPGGAVGPPPPPAELEADPAAFFPTGHEVGYHTGMEYRFAAGSFVEPGPAVCWMRMLRPLIAGQEPTPLERVLVAADSGNGISSALDFSVYLFINVDLSVHLHRLPEGEWVCLDALTIPEPSGLGQADAMLWDERGPLGRACQTLLIAER
jgi:hypothetical protein